ncbi:MAG: hypothetical protein HKO88_01325, partial [Xanthomonadales bacterium]|nr:hypothetical protein [Xanthomonadales bacterium]
MSQDRKFKDECSASGQLNGRRWQQAAWGLSLFLMSGLVSAAGPQTPRPVMQASELLVSPELDGAVLDDPAWKGLVPATGFWQVQPVEGQAA